MRAVKTRHVERRAQRMHEMMDVLDVDAGKLVRLDQGEAYADARRRCMDCSEADRCLNWLENPQAQIAAPDFCPNVDLFKWAGEDRK